MKVKRLWAIALSVSMLFGQGVYAVETSSEAEDERNVAVGQESDISVLETVPNTLRDLQENLTIQSRADIKESVTQTEEAEMIEETREIESGILETISETQMEETEEVVSELPETVVETVEIVGTTEEQQEVMEAETAYSEIAIDSINFPDDNFRKYILAEIDTNGDKKLSQDEINSTTIINVENMGIKSLKGIEFFSALELLDGRSNQLTGVDLSHNTMLINSDLSGNVYDLGMIDGTYFLSEMPEDFDLNKASGWKGAEYDGNENLLKNISGIQGKATIEYIYDLGNGSVAEFSLTCTIPAPEGAIEFKDEKLIAALLCYDTNKDGFITKEELQSVTSLYLSNWGIKDITGLENAVNVTYLSLSDNGGLKDISSLSNLTNLRELSLRNTAIEDIDGLSNLTNLQYLYLDNTGISNVEVLKNLEYLQYVSLEGTIVTDEQCLELLGFENNINMHVGDSVHVAKSLKISNFNPEVAITEGNDKAVYDSYLRTLVAKEIGTMCIHVSCHSVEKDINVTIQDVTANPAVGDDKEVFVQYTPMNTSYPATKNDDAVILDGNGELWSIYPKTEKVQENVKEYVSQWVYSTPECKHYSYIIDKNNSLWVDGVKKYDNVQKVDFPYVLDENNVLHHLYRNDSIENVKEWVVHKNSNGTMIEEKETYPTYILKQDGTLWKIIKGNLVWVDTEVSQLANYGFYVKSDGTYKEAYSGEVIAENISGINSYIGGYYDKDGNFYLNSTGQNLGKIDIKDSLSFMDTEYNSFRYYLSTDNKLYYYNKNTEELEFVADNVDSLGSAPEGRLIVDYLYRLKDGTYIKADGNPMEEGIIKHVSINKFIVYDMYLTKNAGCEVRKNGTLRLTKVKDVWSNSGRWFALRTDGTIWDITDEPKLVFEGDASVRVTDVILNKNKITFTVKGETDTLKATVGPANATDKSVAWSSSNEKVAKVSSSGVVTPVANGTAIITAQTKDGNKTATCEVVVKFPSVATLTNLRAATSGLSKVKLTWSAVSGAEGYLIYAQKAGKYGYVGMTTKGTTFTDAKALVNDYNFYWVFPYVKDANGNMYTGGCQSYKYAKGGVCAAVTNLKAASAIGGVKLTWTASAGSEGYLIYGKTAIGKYGYIGMTTLGTTFTDKKASKTEYNFYWVFSYHKDAEGKMMVGGTPKYVYGKAK